MGVPRDFRNFFQYPLLSQERVKLRTSNLAGIFTRSIPTKAPQIWETRERGRIQGLPKFFEYPYYSRNASSYELQIWQIYSQGPSEQKALKIGEKRERGSIQGLPKFFSVPPIISRTGKATNVQFCTHILSIDQNKSPFKISGKVTQHLRSS